MRLKRLRIDGFKNLNNFELDFTNSDGITVLIGNNGSGKSNVLEAISAIFSGLYKIGTPQRKPKFEYEIEYELHENEYKLSLKKYDDGYRYDFNKNNEKILVKDMKATPDDYLPSELIAIYSGEDMKLWDEYYKHLFNDFLSEVKSNKLRTLPEYRLFYVNRDYWNEALLTLLFSSLENNRNFIKDYLHIETIDSIKFSFNKKKISNFPPNLVVDFVKRINPNLVDSISMSLDDFKQLMENEYEYELFIKLVAATFSGLVDEIEIRFNNEELNINSLSEGEKKQLLLRLTLEILADENTLVLMDEPDANIHVANKVQIKKMLEEYPNRENILTTHSPTLMNVFENNLVYLEEGHVAGKGKAEILQDIAGDIMSFAEQQIVLNSNKDILIVEGKTDEKYITVALEKLRESNIQYQNLDFNFIYLGGSDPENLKKLIEQFQPKENQTIIAFFDNDGAGFKCIKEAFDLITEKQDFDGTIQNNIHIHLYPKKDDFTNADFEIEDYFKIETLRDFMYDHFRTFQDTKKKFKKNDFAEYCIELGAEEFSGFNKLFDLIVDIKGQE